MQLSENPIPALLPYEEHDSRSNKLPSPYIYKIRKPGQVLVYFGARHIHEAGHPQHKLIREEWERFVLETEGQPRVAMKESHYRLGSDDEATAIHKAGETGLAAFLAQESDISIICPEPSDTELYNAVLETIEPQKVLFYELALAVVGWYRRAESRTAEEMLHWRIDRFNLSDTAKKLQLMIQYEDFIRDCKTYGAPGFKPEDRAWWEKLGNPVLTATPLGLTARTMSTYRDKIIVDAIEREWSAGKNIFIVYGRSHAFMQEPYLRAVLV